ncbi:alpha-hydroxy acid oxidase [Antarcticimicrobium sediminis]|uniref:Alpha-hydroxy-acid oxidizing protein n=1 Tax=Antarcticimicrobium sediminis TaxID=2546227 RepID=A0A4R5EPY4_9RHOB|nr:alpha-hydroxy acid oxidase [Antarcticimicrobium sediminis]TDE36724.1 alpha-hydroxy-acid oxidizing protein [Antarcticimicrobium sediminis]
METFGQDLRRSLYRGRDPARAVDIRDLRAMARRRLPALVFEYLEGGAEEELTLRRNRAAYDDIALMPRILRRVGGATLAGDLLGRPAPLPVAVAPTGFNGLLWPQGDIALARAAAAAGLPFTQSTVSNDPLEAVAALPGLRHWMQLYVFQSQAAVEMLLRRAEAAGSEALVLTVDGSVFGNRGWDKRSYRAGTDPTLARKLEMLRHPRWMLDLMRHGTPRFATLAEALPDGKSDMVSAATWLREQTDPDLDWDRVDWLRRHWPRRLILKGLLAPQDVEMAIRHGADAVVLSNHGGRQLDGAPSPIEVLAQAVPIAKGRLKLFVDSGIRRGSDIVKALALGADGVLVGRAALYGLGAAGTPGAGRALHLLQEEAERCAALLGCPSRAELDDSCLFRQPE